MVSIGRFFITLFVLGAFSAQTARAIDPRTGPVIEFVGLHSPRYQSERPDVSILNSFSLGGRSGRGLIITGPNGKGKSTSMRSLGGATVQTQLGGPVPAESGEMTPGNILTFVHGKDRPKDDLSLRDR